jgi:hypothetical protein
LALQAASASPTKARRIGIRIRVLQFNGDEAGVQESGVYLAIRSRVQDQAASRAGRPALSLTLSIAAAGRAKSESEKSAMCCKKENGMLASLLAAEATDDRAWRRKGGVLKGSASAMRQKDFFYLNPP